MTDSKASDRMLDRRGFVAAGAAVATALAAAGSLTGCAPKGKAEGAASGSFAPEGTFEGGKAMTALNDGEWKFMECDKGCGGGCVTKALVKDGVVVRTKTDDTHEDSLEYPQFRSCLRGRCAAEFEFGTDRISYPLKRKNWSPEEPHGELRGKDEWVRISWDEALDTITEQLRKVYTTYGPRAVYYPWDQWGVRSPVLDACGGFMVTWDTCSFGSYLSDLSQLGLPEVSMGGVGTINDRFDIIENSNLIVLYAQDPAWSAIAFAAWNLRAAKENGAEFICVGPFNNASANMLDAKWIRVLPGTDTPFLLAVVYEMLRLDGEQGDIVDWDFVHSYCVGFDDESMPADAKLDENLMGYVRGDYDGVPKTPEWASPLCGTPVEDITYFAQAVGKQADAVLSHGFAAGRCTGSEDVPQLYLTVACLGGHIGKPGNAYGPYWVDYSACGGENLVKAGSANAGWDVSGCEPLCEPEQVFLATLPGGQIPHVAEENISGLEAYAAVLDKKYHNVGSPWGGNWKPLEEKDCDIHVIWGERSGGLRAAPNHLLGIEAFRSVDFVVMRDYVPRPDSCYADIILPVRGRQQTEGLSSKREELVYYTEVLNPDDESQTDRWINEQLLERLGYDASKVYTVSPEQALYNQFSGSQLMNEKGEYEPLLAISQDDIDAMGVEGEPQEGVVTLAEFKEKGIYTFKRQAGDVFTHIGLADFIADPKKNPLPSASGKFELYCQAKADTYNMISFDGSQFKPYPTYHEVSPVEGYELRCFNPHYPRAANSFYTNVPTLREAWEAPFLMNVNDATVRGIADGDDVLISSPVGKVLRQVCVTGLIMEGAVGLPNSLWPKVDEDGIDRGGCGSTLIGGKPTGMGITGQNNAGVRVEKWTGEALEPDSAWQQTIEVTA